ncbi:MAG: PDZ domain-containing protein, partial [Lactobacillus iners]|nr:PDZ domain-containing protein [Lactobacillus iners]
PQSRFYSKLKIGDMIIKANKKNIRSSAALIEYLKKYPLHKKLKLTILRNKKEKQVDGKLINIPRLKKHGIGITLLDNTEIITKAPLKICTPDIGGPSAGLMFTLACYQVFTHKRLSMHKKIVGTGTIEADGHVGTIGCIKQKTIAAARANADIFLVPAECLQGEKKSQTNYQIALKTAKKLKTKMKIVPVYNFRDAINYLKNNK